MSSTRTNVNWAVIPDAANDLFQRSLKSFDMCLDENTGWFCSRTYRQQAETWIPPKSVCFQDKMLQTITTQLEEFDRLYWYERVFSCAQDIDIKRVWVAHQSCFLKFQDTIDAATMYQQAYKEFYIKIAPCTTAIKTAIKNFKKHVKEFDNILLEKEQILPLGWVVSIIPALNYFKKVSAAMLDPRSSRALESKQEVREIKAAPTTPTSSPKNRVFVAALLGHRPEASYTALKRSFDEKKIEDPLTKKIIISQLATLKAAGVFRPAEVPHLSTQVAAMQVRRSFL